MSNAKPDPEPDVDPDAMVNILNPKFGPSAPGRVSRAAFESHFKAEGFEIVDDNGDPIKATSTKASAGGASA